MRFSPRSVVVIFGWFLFNGLCKSASGWTFVTGERRGELLGLAWEPIRLVSVMSRSG